MSVHPPGDEEGAEAAVKERLLMHIPNISMGRMSDLVDFHVIFPNLTSEHPLPSEASVVLATESPGIRARSHEAGYLSPAELEAWRDIFYSAIQEIFRSTEDRIPSDFATAQKRLALGARVPFIHPCSSWQLKDISRVIERRFATGCPCTVALGGQCFFVVNGKGLKTLTSCWRPPPSTRVGTDPGDDSHPSRPHPADPMEALVLALPELDFVLPRAPGESFDATFDVAVEYSVRVEGDELPRMTAGWRCDAVQRASIGLGGSFSRLQDCAAPILGTSNFGGAQGTPSPWFVGRSGVSYGDHYTTTRYSFMSYIPYNRQTGSHLSVRAL